MPFDAQNDIMVQSRPTYNLVYLLVEIGCQESYLTIRTIIQSVNFEKKHVLILNVKHQFMALKWVDKLNGYHAPTVGRKYKSGYWLESGH